MKAILFCLIVILSICSCINKSKSPKGPAGGVVLSTKPQQKSTKDREHYYSRMLTWYADTTHSSIQFRTRHSSVYDVIGWISSFEIKLKGERKDFTDVTVESWADIRTVVMPNMGMAGNVQGIFNTNEHPKVYFKSRKIKHIKGNQFTLEGDMTIKGKSFPIDLDVTFNGFGRPLTFALPGFTVKGKINVYDYGLKVPPDFEHSEPGVQLLGDTIYFTSNLRFYFKDE